MKEQQDHLISPYHLPKKLSHTTFDLRSRRQKLRRERERLAKSEEVTVAINKKKAPTE